MMQRRIPRWFTVAAASPLLLAVGMTVVPLSAQESAPARTLTPGKGADLTMVRCALCHEITHITRARLSRGEWQDNVRNMVERGMPIAPEEIPLVVEYLATYYNRDSAPPAPDPSADAAQDPMQRLLADNACLSCHAIDRQVIGPSFREVAVRYAGDKGAGVRLAAKIRAGGAGNWGSTPMPPHAGLTDGQLAQMTEWVLTRK